MNLDDSSAFSRLDPQNMLSYIDGLPFQLLSAWEAGLSYDLPPLPEIEHFIVGGMGGSAIGADLLSAYVAAECPVPLVVLRDYELPAWASGQHTLFVASSHSGNTEETLFALQQAMARRCSCLAITTGGALAEIAGQAGAPVWRFEHAGQPRAAVGFSFGLLLALAARLGLIADPSAEVHTAVRAMQDLQSNLQAAVPAARNPAKRMAGQLMERYVVVFGAGILAPVARRWKTQINELAKAWAQFEYIPEADHNTLAGLQYPAEQLNHLMALFLRCASDHPRNRFRLDLTRQMFMIEGINTDFIDAQGENRLAQQWTSLLYGDYVAYYLAMAYQTDPTPVEALQGLKEALKDAAVD